jgi:hypothetical protein
MSQPPGPYGPYSQPSPPGPYGPPAPYGQPAGGYPPGGGLPPPKQNNALPWIIVGSAVLLSGLGLLLVVLLTGDDSSPTAAVATSAATAAEPAGTPDQNPSGGAAFSSTASGDEPLYEGSPDAAIGYMNALLARDNQRAYDLACDADRELMDVVSAATRRPAPDVLAQTFYESNTNGEFMTGGTFDGLSHDLFTSTDQANFTVQLESGDEVQVQVVVDRDLGVCGIA